MKRLKTNNKTKQESEGFTLKQVLKVVEELYDKSEKDNSAKKVLDTAREKWENTLIYAN